MSEIKLINGKAEFVEDEDYTEGFDLKKKEDERRPLTQEEEELFAFLLVDNFRM